VGRFLRHSVHVCESELAWLDMSINFNKSCYIRIGLRCQITPVTTISLSGHCGSLKCDILAYGMSCSLDACKAVVPCQNKIILKNYRPEPPPSVDRPRIILFQHGTTSEMK